MSTPNKPRQALFWFGLRQTLKGAIIVGLIAGGMLALQGVAYQKAYPDAAAREKLALSLANAPGLGFLYGDPHDLHDGTEGYMVYRVLGPMGVVAAVWALMTITKLLRGAEEEGRFELIRTGATTPRQATTYLALGFAGAWWIALLLSHVITLLAVKAGGITTTETVMWSLNVAIFIPALLFGAAGILTSQLGLTRGRAILFSIVPLAGLFLARGIANTSASWHWLLRWTPFGWVQLIDPIHGVNHTWLYVSILTALGLAALGIFLAQRDYGASIIRSSTTARSHFGLLKQPWQLALRQNFWVMFGWACTALLIIGAIAGLTNTAVSALEDAGNLSDAVYKLGGTNNIKLAFLGAGVVFTVMTLLIMSVTLVGEIRRDEAKQYLDNILVAPQRRSSWLMQRLLLSFGAVLCISIACGMLLQLIANGEHITLSFSKVMATSVCVVGSAGFLIGLGGLLYGFVPRLTVIVLYAVIGWSFLITLLASAVKLNTVLWHSSLFQYTNFNLAQWPDWETFGWFMALGIAMAAAGLWGFARRDIVPE